MASGIFIVLLVWVIAVALTDAYGNEHSGGSVPQSNVYGQSIRHGYGHGGTVARPAKVYNKRPQGHVHGGHGSVPQSVDGHSIRHGYGHGGIVAKPAVGYNIKPHGHVHGGQGSVPQSKVHGQSFRHGYGYGGTVARPAKGYNKRPQGHVYGGHAFGRNREYDKVVIHSNNGHIGGHNKVVVNGHRTHGYAISHGKVVVRVHQSDGYQTGHNKVIVDVHGGHRVGHGYKEFTIVGGRFSYKGDAYRLQCDKKRFVSLWKRCYGLYNSRSICFGRLREQKLFVAYTSGSYHGHSHIKNDRTIVAKVDNKLGYQGGRKNVVINVHQGYGDGYQGFNFVDGRFSYKGVDYQLKCGKKRFLNLWKRCFGLYNSRSICFGRLQKQQLFVVYTSGSYHGHGYQEGQKNVFIDVHKGYEDGYQGFNVVDHRFSYKGVAYQLKCDEKNFLSLWKRCYGLYHSKSICFDRLRKQQLFVIYTSGGLHEHGYQGGQKHVVIDVEQGYQGFKVAGRRFSYQGVAYQLKCGKERFESLWKRCYGVYHSRNKCFERLQKQKLFVVYTAGGLHGHGYQGGQKHVVIDVEHGYRDIYQGFKVVGRRFSYKGVAYQLKCGKERFESLWKRCYGVYHSRSKCFETLQKQKIFVVYTAGSYHKPRVIQDHREPRYNSVEENIIIDIDHSYADRYNGLKIVGRRFSYKGAAFQLKCSKKRFISLWRRCYGLYHSRSICFGRLKKEQLFVVYSGGYNKNDRDDGYYRTEQYKDYGHHGHRHGRYGFKIVHRQFSYRGEAYRLKCTAKRFYSVWKRCYDLLHSRSSCFKRLYKQKLFIVYSGHKHGQDEGYYGHEYRENHYGSDYDHGYRYHENYNDHRKHYLQKHLDAHRKIADHHVKRVTDVANSHLSSISKISQKHKENINNEANKHVDRISNEADKHIKKFIEIADLHINRLHNHTKHHISVSEEQHQRHLKEREYQHKIHLATKEEVHHRHEKFISKQHHSEYDGSNAYHDGFAQSHSRGETASHSIDEYVPEVKVVRIKQSDDFFPAQNSVVIKEENTYGY